MPSGSASSPSSSDAGSTCPCSPSRAAAFGEWRTARPEDVDATVLVIGSADGDYTVDVIAGSP